MSNTMLLDTSPFLSLSMRQMSYPPRLALTDGNILMLYLQ